MTVLVGATILLTALFAWSIRRDVRRFGWRSVPTEVDVMLMLVIGFLVLLTLVLDAGRQ